MSMFECRVNGVKTREFSLVYQLQLSKVRDFIPKKSLALFCPPGPDDHVGIIVSMTILGLFRQNFAGFPALILLTKHWFK
jgi:hypothetical protein